MRHSSQGAGVVGDIDVVGGTEAGGPVSFDRLVMFLWLGAGERERSLRTSKGTGNVNAADAGAKESLRGDTTSIADDAAAYLRHSAVWGQRRAPGTLGTVDSTRNYSILQHRSLA